ncbi:MAG: tRNA pseudouridine(38-40) synthase TruA [Ilumatobacteraceae bacterium]|nr:tRNA pseudouridine(38-40) synthase TruA [Ilumatobacteraceae bacterium]MBL6760056.1 tRNA pseudouridine(38-40) synthase TruA [Ilumatobacteraceae bacterium]
MTEIDAAQPATVRVRITVAYLGSAFHGAADNPGVRTVVGDLRSALTRVTGDDIEITLAGRTDAGVHATGQVISLDLPVGIDLENLLHRLNRMCAPDIALRDAEVVSDDFDARFSATWRRYRYTIHHAAAVDPLTADRSWHVPSALDFGAMSAAASELIGEHDFSSFCRRPDADRPVSLVRRVLDISISRRAGHGIDGGDLIVEVTGTAFCHQMVRSIVGTLVDVGRGRLSPSDLPAILAARDRSAAGQVAPPHGLVLAEVGYDGERWDAETG